MEITEQIMPYGKNISCPWASHLLPQRACNSNYFTASQVSSLDPMLIFTRLLPQKYPLYFCNKYTVSIYSETFMGSKVAVLISKILRKNVLSYLLIQNCGQTRAYKWIYFFQCVLVILMYLYREGLPRFSRFQWCCQPKFRRTKKI